jgi:hypothetical protein
MAFLQIQRTQNRELDLESEVLSSMKIGFGFGAHLWLSGPSFQQRISGLRIEHSDDIDWAIVPVVKAGLKLF